MKPKRTWTLILKHLDETNPRFAGVLLNDLDLPVRSVTLTQTHPKDLMVLQLEVYLHQDSLRIVGPEEVKSQESSSAS